MTTLFKSEKKDVKASFPKINTSDDFKSKFFKLARYASKVVDVNGIDILDCIKTLEADTIDFSAYAISSFEDMVDDAKKSAKIVLDSRAKTEDLSTVKFLFAEGKPEKTTYMIVPNCPTVNDGSLFCVRSQADYDHCKIYSIGFLLLASALEHAVKKYQDEALNKSTLFNKMGFRKVEIDTQKYDGEIFDYEEFSKVEQDFLAILNKLPQAKAQPELKFRRLGKHKAWGIYSPFLNILAVDVRHTESFIHEYGHYLDFKHGDEVYSEKSTFFPIVNAYREKLLELAEDDKYSQKLPKNKRDYYLIPTEIFARAFELWVSGTIVSDATIISSTEIYNNQPEYIAFSHIKELVFSFFNAIFPNSTLSNQSLVAELKSQKKTRSPKVWEETAPTNIGEQLSLF